MNTSRACQKRWRAAAADAAAATKFMLFIFQTRRESHARMKGVHCVNVYLAGDNWTVPFRHAANQFIRFSRCRPALSESLARLSTD